MRPILTGTVILVAALPIAPVKAEDQGRSATPAERYRKLLSEYKIPGPGKVLTDQERLKFVGKVYRRRYELVVKMVELAEAFPDDPVALDALREAVWQVNTIPWPVEIVGEDRARPKAFALLQRDHVGSDKLGAICRRISYGYCKEYEAFLRAVLEKNPYRQVQAETCLALARLLNNRRHKLELIEEQPKQIREFEELFGKEYIAALLRQDRSESADEAEILLQRAAHDYGEVRIPGVGVAGEMAEVQLFEMRNLSAGKQAPDIEGSDQDGRQFKLSDYRGKVVLLYFWSEY